MKFHELTTGDHIITVKNLFPKVHLLVAVLVVVVDVVDVVVVDVVDVVVVDVVDVVVVDVVEVVVVVDVVDVVVEVLVVVKELGHLSLDWDRPIHSHTTFSATRYVFLS